MESIFSSFLLHRILRMHSVESNDNKAFSIEPEMDEENSSENICVGWCRYTHTHNVELNARSWDTLHHTWDKEFPHMFSAFQLDLLRRWMLCDCICIEHRNTKIPIALISHVFPKFISLLPIHIIRFSWFCPYNRKTVSYFTSVEN